MIELTLHTVDNPRYEAFEAALQPFNKLSGYEAMEAAEQLAKDYPEFVITCWIDDESFMNAMIVFIKGIHDGYSARVLVQYLPNFHFELHDSHVENLRQAAFKMVLGPIAGLKRKPEEGRECC